MLLDFTFTVDLEILVISKIAISILLARNDQRKVLADLMEVMQQLLLDIFSRPSPP
jgi:hypothetical protein